MPYNELETAWAVNGSMQESIFGSKTDTKCKTSSLSLDIFCKPYKALPTSWAFIGWLHDKILGHKTSKSWQTSS